MKTIINITGQINGNNRLVNAISTFDSEMKRGQFYGYSITFKTKAAAKKALWAAYRYLVSNEPEFRHGISYSKYGTLSYDASRAEIDNYNA